VTRGSAAEEGGWLRITLLAPKEDVSSGSVFTIRFVWMTAVRRVRKKKEGKQFL
jgi:hypothetical protein